MAEAARSLLTFSHELGVNDPLTHLEQYLQHGEAAMPSIDEDLITDCAERLEKPVFINSVTFDRYSGDFISRENRFSMRAMTNRTAYKLSNNVADIRLYERAKIESLEVDRLVKWFDIAEPNDAFIVESLPLTETETYTISRIYQKVNQHELVEHIVTLHNASTETFNRLHAEIGANVPDSQSPLELLDNMYAHRPSPGQNFQGFIEQYVAIFDGVLAAHHPGRDFHFGLEGFERADMQDDIDKVRAQIALRSVYLDSVRALSEALREGQRVSSWQARDLLDSKLQHIVATLNIAPREHLANLAVSQSKTAAYELADHYGGQAAATGIRYEGACPSGSAGAATQEATALAHALRANHDPSQCGTCPKCGQEYYVPDQLYKQRILHCGKCKATVHFNGQAVDQKKIDEYYGIKKPAFSAFDILSRGLQKIKHELRIKKISQEYEAAETEFEKKRQIRLLRQEQLELQELDHSV